MSTSLKFNSKSSNFVGNVQYSENGKELISFKSFYKLSGNELTITADEYYRQNIMDKSLYEEFRTVINSAADFNKIVLVLEPEN